MKEKSETKAIFEQFHAIIQNQFKTNIQVLKTDNARDFFNASLAPYLKSIELFNKALALTHCNKNVIAECKNCHTLEVSWSLMFQTNASKKFWGEAVLTATYI